MATSHLCPDHPDRDKDGEKWRDGGSTACPYHNKDGRRQAPVKWGKKARAKIDREVGVVGTDYGGGYTDPKRR